MKNWISRNKCLNIKNDIKKRKKKKENYFYRNLKKKRNEILALKKNKLS